MDYVKNPRYSCVIPSFWCPYIQAAVSGANESADTTEEERKEQEVDVLTV